MSLLPKDPQKFKALYCSAADNSKNRHRKEMNRAIRAECPGGDRAIDALETFTKIARRQWDNEEVSFALDTLHNIVEDMRDAIRDEYGLDDY